MGCYGIGVSRLVGVLAEHFADDKGLAWPEAVAPAKVHLVRLGDDKNVVQEADKLFETLKSSGIGVIYDDREVHAGAKFADADLLGMPYRVVISTKTLENTTVELKKRSEESAQVVELDKLVETLKT